MDAAKRATVEQLLAHPFLTQQIVVPTQRSKRLSTSATTAAAGFKRGVSIDLDTHRWDAAWMSCSSSTASSTSSYGSSEAHSKAHTVAGHPQRHSSSQEGADGGEHSVDLAHSIAGTDTTVQTAPAASTARTNVHIGV